MIIKLQDKSEWDWERCTGCGRKNCLYKGKYQNFEAFFKDHYHSKKVTPENIENIRANLKTNTHKDFHKTIDKEINRKLNGTD